MFLSQRASQLLTGLRTAAKVCEQPLEVGKEKELPKVGSVQFVANLRSVMVRHGPGAATSARPPNSRRYQRGPACHFPGLSTLASELSRLDAGDDGEPGRCER
jgi:hypothetical protein